MQHRRVIKFLSLMFSCVVGGMCCANASPYTQGRIKESSGALRDMGPGKSTAIVKTRSASKGQPKVLMRPHLHPPNAFVKKYLQYINLANS